MLHKTLELEKNEKTSLLCFNLVFPAEASESPGLRKKCSGELQKTEKVLSAVKIDRGVTFPPGAVLQLCKSNKRNIGRSGVSRSFFFPRLFSLPSIITIEHKERGNECIW